MVFVYNKNEGHNIIPVCVGTLPSLTYQKQLTETYGINVIDFPDVAIGDRPTVIAKYVIENNANTWTTVPTTPETYGAAIVPAKANVDKLTMSPKSITDGSMDMQWQFKPSNPYDIMTGSIEVRQWVWLVFSNYSVLTMTMMALVGAVPCWGLYMKFIKKKKFQLFRKEVPSDDSVS